MKKNFKKEKTGLASPWYTYFHEVQELFRRDPDVRVEVEDDDKGLEIKLFVENPTKAEALTELLPPERDFGGVKVRTTVIPANNLNKPAAALFEQAFEGNPVFSETIVIEGVYTNPITYVVFEDEIAQFYNDNLGDPHGNVSTLYQELAKDIFDLEGVSYCTKPLYE